MNMENVSFHVGIAPSKLRGIGSLVVRGGTAGWVQNMPVWCNLELNLIGQARHWRAVEKHRPTSDQPRHVQLFFVALALWEQTLLGINTISYRAGKELFSVLRFSEALGGASPWRTDPWLDPQRVCST